MNLLLHPATQRQLAQLEHTLPHANIVVGEQGIGRQRAILEVLKKYEPGAAKAIENNTFERLLTVTSEENSIGIDIIKEVEQLLQLHDAQRRYVVIPHAERLTLEAQNAFLKTFEETPPQVSIFLIIENVNQLLRTIRSRANVIQVHKPSRAEFLTWLKDKHAVTGAEAEQLYYLSSGRIGTAVSVLQDKATYDTHYQAMQDAKSFLAVGTQERLALLKPIEKDGVEITRLLVNLQTICRAAMANSAAQQQPAKVVQWSKKVALTVELLTYLKKNVSTRLIVDKLVLNL